MHLTKTKRLLATGCCAVLFSGCAAGLFLNKDQDLPKASAQNPAVRCVCFWQPGEGRGIDNLPTRGFIGRILFLTRNSHIPVAVDGDVRVFLFDDQGTRQEQVKPIHQFDFVGGAWRKYLVNTQFGPAYNVFIPYVRKGQHQTKGALQFPLTQTEAPAIYS